ncbi:hypothetical protein Ahy_A10g050289 [Arachis hypogaea]|uniref:Uncharacterized protein n=1 Tax=Arachis hypogaea TaxID=3818 RepID=A0A445B908_ARAHY|nr:hypothetical protein Ahy_A10g050289 [Arachis hypogaea]
MAELKAVNQEAFRYLNAMPPMYWSRSRFTYNSKVDTLVNNMFESFNSVIVDAREKPVVTMLEEIRVKLMTRWAENRLPAQQVQHLLHPHHNQPPELFLHLSLPLPHFQANLLLTSLPGFLEHLTFLQRN